MDTHELAWAAGFFDGEGSSYCSCKDNHNPSLRLSVPQKGIITLRRFQKAILGIGSLVKRQPGISVLNTNNFEDTQAVMALLWKYLSPVKRQQYQAAVEQYRNNYKGNLQIGWKVSQKASPALLNAVTSEVNIVN